MHVAFFAEQLYYLPQFTPVIAALVARGHRTTTLIRIDPALGEVPLPALDAAGAMNETLRVTDAAEAMHALRRLAPDWAVFGSFPPVGEATMPGAKTALVYHGIGVKNVLFDPRLNAFDLRCVESRRVLDEVLAREPSVRERLALVGFAKLDPLFAAPRRARASDDGTPPVLLYAPTFYPSSLERMPRRLSALAPGARWIVKPHFFSWTIEKYAAQRRRLAEWAREPGVEVLGPESYDLVPLMARADVLISDASSALFEFAALERPVVWCRFLKLRWSYRGLLRWRYDRRIDPNATRYETIASGVDRPEDLPRVIGDVLARPLRPSAERRALIEHLIGPRDGQASERIVDALEARR